MSKAFLYDKYEETYITLTLPDLVMYAAWAGNISSSIHCIYCQCRDQLMLWITVQLTITQHPQVTCLTIAGLFINNELGTVVFVVTEL